MRSEGALTWIGLGSLGRVAYVFILLSLVLGLAQLEQVLRATHDPLRLRLKYMLIGLGALSGYGVYQASRLLLLSIWQTEMGLVGGVATLVSVGLIAYGLGRSRLEEITAKAYFSSQVI